MRRLRTAIQQASRQCRTDACTVDLGCGDAPYRDFFQARNMRYIGCDLQGGTCDVLLVPNQPVPLADGIAQAVLSFQVLEHVWEIDWYLAETKRLLADDGVLILSTHGAWPYHPHPGDYRRWTRQGLVRELDSRGFTVETVVPIVGPLAYATLMRTLGMHTVLGRMPLVGRAAAAVLCSFNYLRMWVEDCITPAQWKQDNAAVYLVIAKKAALG